MPIPYARAIAIRDVDGTETYAVECPICHESFKGSGSSEDAITKSASRKYATHFERQHTTDSAVEIATLKAIAIELDRQLAGFHSVPPDVNPECSACAARIRLRSFLEHTTD